MQPLYALISDNEYRNFYVHVESGTNRTDAVFGTYRLNPLWIPKLGAIEICEFAKELGSPVEEELESRTRNQLYSVWGDCIPSIWMCFRQRTRTCKKQSVLQQWAVGKCSILSNTSSSGGKRNDVSEDEQLFDCYHEQNICTVWIVPING